MKFFFYILALLSSLQGFAQHTISGKFTPSGDFSWLVAYQLQTEGQNYVADGRIEDGMFSLNLPENSPPGSYRLVYGIPEDQFYFDVIYDAKDDISLLFDKEQGLSFSNSSENKLLHAYYREINAMEERIITAYLDGTANRAEFKRLILRLRQTQENYEGISEGLIAGHFIKANAPYIPSVYEKFQDYVMHKKEHYFAAIDVRDTVLQASGYLVDKLSDFVFTAIALAPMDQSQMEEAINKNVEKLNEELNGIATNFKLNVFFTLWKQAADSGFHTSADFIYDNYLNLLALETDRPQIIQHVETQTRLRIGSKAPNIFWQVGGEQRTLHSIDSAQNYLLVFWSSTCSHCLHELPLLQEVLMENRSTKVIAIGMEDDDENWKKEAAHFTRFEHGISLGKWESSVAKLYDIQRTPTYYFLDDDKRIVAKPRDYRQLLEVLGEHTIH